MQLQLHTKSLSKFALLAGVILSLGACSYEEGTQTSFIQKFKWNVSTEKLLDAPGFTSFAGLNGKRALPMEKHAAAKRRVHPSQTRGHLPYTDYIRRSDVAAGAKFRVVELEKKSGAFGSSFEIAGLDTIVGAGAIPTPSAKPSALASNIQLASANFEAERIAKPAPKPFIVSARAEDNPGLFERLAAATQAAIGQTAEQSQDEGLSVVNLRMGDYEDKTRLVLDLSAAAKYDYDLNNVDSVLVVHVDGAGWNLDAEKTFNNHPLIESYEVQTTDKDETLLQITLKKPSRMLMSGFVRPDKAHGHRIFFDVAAL